MILSPEAFRIDFVYVFGPGFRPKERRQDVAFVETVLEGRSEVARGAERDPLGRHGSVDGVLITSRDEPGHVDPFGTFEGYSPEGAYFFRHEPVSRL